jgi:hypothetical protein
MTDIELFEKTGRALSAHDPRGALKAVLGIRPDSIRQLLNKRLTLRPGHFRDLLDAVVKQQEELTNVERELREWLAKQPPE